ncbi:MAG: hypothetical protein AMJ90_02490 [candidate division Zixibacteria bacterium SM23_73_2]|nr:MAG: hypothetical protein AMJ90_02490 [candidate division Zixibacteria bacterium SM23_73_2]
MITIEDNKFLIGKEEYYPFSAEIHYFRVDKRYWSVCFERIKKAGFRIISTCVPWNLHEISPGDFDFLGQTDSRTDLVVFLELAREFGFKVILKVGPYIGSEWENGGYPEFIFSSPDVLARDSENQPIKTSDRVKVKQGYVPCYHHPFFKTYLKRYFTALSSVLKNYIYPKGPVFLIQLDNQLSFGHNSGPFDANYSENIVKNLFPDYLEDMYKDIKKLNRIYGRKYKDFKEMEPPRNLKVKKPSDLVKYFDWLSFRDKYLEDFINELRDLFLSFEVNAMFFTNSFSALDLYLPFSWSNFDQEKTFLSADISWDENSQLLNRYIKYFVGCARFRWASSISCGRWSDSPQEGKKYFPITPKKTKFFLLKALRSGIIGFNYYMFVEGDLWYDSPLAPDGAIQDNYDIIKKINLLTEKIPLQELKSLGEISLAYYRPYFWFSQMRVEKPFGYVNILLKKTHRGLSQDLDDLKLDYCISDLWLEESSDKSRILFVPCAEFMDEGTQNKIVEITKEGKTIILFGLLPKLDDKMRRCDALSRALNAKTKEKLAIEEIDAFGQRFDALSFGYINASTRAQVVAKAFGKKVGVRIKLGKGEVWLFTFDIASFRNHRKLTFLEEVLKKTKVETLAWCSVPDIDLSVHKNDKSVVLYLLNTKISSNQRTSFILKLFSRKLGIKGKRIRLVDPLENKVIKTSSKELKNGILMTLDDGDSRMYLVEGRAS